MKSIIDYLKENEAYTIQLPGHDVHFKLNENNIIVQVATGALTDIYWLKADEIQDVIYDQYKLEIRFCEECGKPYDAGFMAGDGEWYCCEDCFEPVMDRDYGQWQWRSTEDEGCFGGYYEYLNELNEWEDTGIFYTEWN